MKDKCVLSDKVAIPGSDLQITSPEEADQPLVASLCETQQLLPPDAGVFDWDQAEELVDVRGADTAGLSSAVLR